MGAFDTPQGEGQGDLSLVKIEESELDAVDFAKINRDELEGYLDEEDIKTDRDLSTKLNKINAHRKYGLKCKFSPDSKVRLFLSYSFIEHDYFHL